MELFKEQVAKLEIRKDGRESDIPERRAFKISLREQALKGLAAFLVLMIVLTMLSRTADSLTIAIVNTGTAQKRAIDHTIKADGVFSQNQEEAVVVVGNIRVRSVNVARGSLVAAGDVLMELDLDDIQEQILEIENSIKELELNARAKKENAAIAKGEELKNLTRAKEDYDRAAASGNTAVTKAYNAMTEAYQAWQNFKNNRGNVSSGDSMVAGELLDAYHQKTAAVEAARQALTDLEEEMKNAIVQAQDEEQQAAAEQLSNTRLKEIKEQVETSYSSSLQNTQEMITQAEKEQSQTQAAYEQYVSEQKTATKESLDSQEAAFKNIYEEKKAVYDSAVENMNDTLYVKGNTIEDATRKEEADYSYEITQMSLEEKQRKLSKLQALMDAEGSIYAPISGIVTEKAVSTGDLTPATKSFLLADLDSGLRFTAQLGEDQKKYVSVGDTVTLNLSGRKSIKNLRVETLTPNAENASKIDVVVRIDSQTEYFSELYIGGTAELEIENKSEAYSITVPLEAVHEESGRKYLLVIKESASILGTQLSVEQLEVVVLEKNTSYAALAEGALASGQKFVTSAGKDLEAGDRVRLASE